MHWYLVHTKPKQENCALENLERQGYECYLPTLSSEKITRGALVLSEEPLFPRYLFIRLGLDDSAKSWGPIRSTKGVSRLVTFGTAPAKIHDTLINQLKEHEARMRISPARIFSPGERVCLTAAPFAGIEGIYQTANGERRVIVLIELMSRPVTVTVTPAELRKLG